MEAEGVVKSFEERRAVIRVGDIMITSIYTIHSEDRVALARLRMLRYGVGALPVVDEDRTLVGILTLRDVDLAGPESLVLPVRELMTRNLVTRKKDALLGEIVDIMMETGIQRIPIVDEEKKLIGLVTQSTVIRSIRCLIK
ncbi:MAG: CBS domain-containing protein [Candidatus Bathyarchaeia archaeon]